MKLANLLALDPLYDGVGLDSASALDRQVWEEFADKPEALHSTAQTIRAVANEIRTQAERS